ncbi:discoidin domain-containing protein [Eubacterium sp. BX4]|uniref:Discoidin domain-containing protein n=1 Tax=Eubacterium segne TaxID=2763045 RepID=A0ABR7F3K6_9FIRM|nr:glycosyl hydrolase [Eubacterium segne]MBC5667767.1 discoidin domain-containing protein [Eubacterium segne]
MKSKRIIAVFLMALMIITTGLSEVKNMNIKAADTENIAYKRTITASSVESDEYLASNAVDGDGTTRWASEFADNQNLIVDLWQSYTISTVKVAWEAAYASQFQVQVSNDNTTWTTVYENYNATGGTQTIEFTPVSARYVKIYCIKRATEYGFSIYEFEIYKDSVGGSTIKSDAASARKKVMEYLYSMQGQKTIVGIHNREPNSEPSKQTNQAYAVTGQYPALWSGDFLFSSSDVSNRWNMIYECKKQWENGSIVQLMLHVTPPTQAEAGNWDGGVVSKLTDEQWSSLITNGGELNKAWKKRLDTYAQYISYLKDNGVPVLFRPFHEMNQSMFWWAGRKGTNGTGALYRLTRDYLEKEKGLDNIIWVWDMQDLSYDWSEYNPGNDYWDIFAVDIYNSDYFTEYKYNQALSVAENKLIAIGECDKLPTAQQLKEQPRWSFVMSWAELTFSHNTNSEIQNLYWAENTIVRNDLPDLKGKETLNVSDDVSIRGYQISTTLGGIRVVSGVKPEINEKNVEKTGFVYALEKTGDVTNNISDDEMYVGNENDYIKSFESTQNGLMGYKDGENNYVMTMLFEKNNSQEFSTKYKVRAYAVLSDGTYVYGKVHSYSIYNIAEAMYENKLMKTASGHDYLYDSIISVVEPSYKKINFEWSGSIVK